MSGPAPIRTSADAPAPDGPAGWQAVILAGGTGTRIRSVAGGRPKVLIPVAGRPFLEHQLGMLAASGVRDVLLCIGHLGEQILAHVGDGSRFGVRVRCVFEDPAHLLGTGGALVHALPLLHERFMVMYGDSYLPIDYAAFAAAFDAAGLPAMMSVYRNEGRWDHSNARVAGGRVAYYDKRAPAGAADCIDYGLMAFRREVLAAYAHRPPPLDLALVLQDLVARGELAAWEAPCRFYEIGKPEGLRELEEKLAGGSP